MVEMFIGTIFYVVGQWAPHGTVPVDGRCLSVERYAALASLVQHHKDYQFGGTQFCLPDLMDTGPAPGIYPVIVVYGTFPSKSEEPSPYFDNHPRLPPGMQ